MSNCGVHDEHVRKIAYNPNIIGLEKIILSTCEVNIFKRDRIISQPDNLLFDPTTKTLYNVEYKCHDNRSQGHHAEYQLKRAENMLKNLFTDFRIVNLYIHDNYKTEVIR